MSENGHERPVGSDGSRTQSRKPEPENKKGHVTNFEKSILCNNFDFRNSHHIATYLMKLKI